MNLRLILIIVSCAHGQPILTQIGGLFESLGLKYIPPPSKEKVSTEELLFQPVDKEKALEAVVFTETDGWLQSSSSEFLYRTGEDASTYYEAKYWCQEVGGRLAEIYDQHEMEIVRALVKRHQDADFWLGLEKSNESWLSGARREYQNWADGEPNRRFSERCVVLSHDRQYKWAGCNCGSQTISTTQMRALCQKKISRSVTYTTTAPEPKSDSPRCEVTGVSLSGEDWISRYRNVSSSSECRQNCLNTYQCNFWTWRSDTRLCYLKTEDGRIVEDVFSVSGTTSARQGCHNKLLDIITSLGSPVVEYCRCKTVSLDVVSGYIDPRSLPIKETENNTKYDNLQLGRLIQTSACPQGEVLSCTDDTPKKVTSAKTPQPNITDCLVYDVRLSVGGLISKIMDVPNPATCHSHCLVTPGCLYWTWRGDTPTRKCFLLPHEGRMVRRQGAASGTVASNLGCQRTIVEQVVEAREEEEEVCDCEIDPDYDLVNTGLIDPRALPTGRIVNAQAIQAPICSPGYKRVCYGPKTVDNTQQTRVPKLWSSGVTAGSARNIPKRETDAAVNFPQ